MNQQQVQVDLSKTTGVKCSCGNHFFDEAMIIRKISRLFTGATQDQMTLVPVFVCRSCGEPLKEFFPSGMADIENDLGWTKVQDLSIAKTHKLYQ